MTRELHFIHVRARVDRIRAGVVGSAVGAVLAACVPRGTRANSRLRPGGADANVDASTGVPDGPSNTSEPDAGSFPDVGFEDAACAPPVKAAPAEPTTAVVDAEPAVIASSATKIAGTCPPQLRPPVGPFGTSVGQAFPNLAFSDCDGNTLCEAKASYFFIFAGW